MNITEEQRADTLYVNGTGHTTRDETNHVIHEDDNFDLMKQSDGCVCELFRIYNIFDLLDPIYVNIYSKHKFGLLKGILQSMMKWDPNPRLQILDVYNLYFCADKYNFLLTHDLNDYNKYFPKQREKQNGFEHCHSAQEFHVKRIVQIMQLI